MVYRSNHKGKNYILDHFNFLQDGDTIILNAWKDLGSLCWKKIGCVVNDAYLVLGYPEKSFKLEIWELANFLYSFGENGLWILVDAINLDVSDWPEIQVWNVFPYNIIWDGIFLTIIIIDLYGPLFRMTFLAW
jgi:hypothetical protein